MTELQRLARCLADDYQFECQGGPLRNCTEWRALCAAINTLAVHPPSGASPQAEMTQCDYCHTWRSRPCGEGCCWQPAPVSPVEPEPPYRETPAGDRIFRHTCGTPEDDGECMACGQIDCPDREPLHYHHDGCPCCSQKPTVEPEPCVWRITSGPLGTWVKPTCVEGAIPAPWGTERAKACHLCGAPLKVEREQPDEQPAEIPAAPHKPVVNLMEALKKSLDSLDSARKR